MEWLKACLRGIVIFAIAHFVFWYVAHFTEIQSIVLAFLALFLLAGLSSQNKQRNAFEPFQIRMELNWYAILQDHMAFDDIKWKALTERPRNHGYSVLHDGITLTVLRPTLWYSHNRHEFFSQVNFAQAIPELTEPDRFFASRGIPDRNFTPRMILKLASEKHSKQYPWLHCIQIDLITQDSNERRSTASAFSGIDDGSANIRLATLPDAVFNDYYGDENFTMNLGVKNNTDVKALLAHYGWRPYENDEHEYRSSPIMHKYLTVSYRGI